MAQGTRPVKPPCGICGKSKVKWGDFAPAVYLCRVCDMLDHKLTIALHSPPPPEEPTDEPDPV